LIGWSNPNKQTVLEGFAFFSNIMENFPKADMRFVPLLFIVFCRSDQILHLQRYLQELICFDADKFMNVVNFSCADPSLFCLKVPSPIYTTPYICYRGSSVPARCLIMGMVHEDRTRAPYQLSNGKWMKSMSLIPFALEADRMIAATAAIFQVEQFRGQVNDGNILSLVTRQGVIGKALIIYIYMATYAQYDPDSGGGSSSGITTKRGRFAKPTSTVGSPSQTSIVSLRGPEEDSAFICPFTVFNTDLGNVSVPIMDARGKQFKLPDDVKRIEKFPRFSGTVPQDSVILACYTTSKYEKNDVCASFNILWAAVLCGNDALVSICIPCFLILT